jgi:hypothetical protein
MRDEEIVVNFEMTSLLSLEAEALTRFHEGLASHPMSISFWKEENANPDAESLEIMTNKMDILQSYELSILFERRATEMNSSYVLRCLVVNIVGLVNHKTALVLKAPTGKKTSWIKEMKDSNKMLSDDILFGVAQQIVSRNNEELDVIAPSVVKFLQFDVPIRSTRVSEAELELFSVLKGEKSRKVFLPLHYGNHWMLLFLTKEERKMKIVAYDPWPDFERLANVRNRFLYQWEAIAGLHELPQDIEWTEPYCNHQSDSLCCGIYVLMFMFIVSRSFATTTTSIREDLSFFCSRQLSSSDVDNTLRPLLSFLISKS